LRGARRFAEESAEIEERARAAIACARAARSAQLAVAGQAHAARLREEVLASLCGTEFDHGSCYGTSTLGS
jgi:hypothetical protein